MAPAGGKPAPVLLVADRHAVGVKYHGADSGEIYQRHMNPLIGVRPSRKTAAKGTTLAELGPLIMNGIRA